MIPMKMFNKTKKTRTMNVKKKTAAKKATPPKKASPKEKKPAPAARAKPRGRAKGPSSAKKKKPAESADEKVAWAQCEACDKWRVLANVDDPSKLPDTWTCADNADPAKAAAGCAAPEDREEEASEAGALPAEASEAGALPMPQAAPKTQVAAQPLPRHEVRL